MSCFQKTKSDSEQGLKPSNFQQPIITNQEEAIKYLQSQKVFSSATPSEKSEEAPTRECNYLKIEMCLLKLCLKCDCGNCT